MKFTAYAQTNLVGSRVEAEFEIDDDALEGMSDDERDEFLHDQAMEAVFERGLVEIYYEEAEQ